MAVYAADVGSISEHRFGWARGVGSSGKIETNDDICALAAGVVEDLKDGRPVALGFECPLFVPIRAEPERILAGREGESNRPWSGGAGIGSLVVGLVEAVWVLREVRARLAFTVPPLLAWVEFAAQRRGLFLWEAFVTGLPKGENHQKAARCAVSAFRRALRSPASAFPAEDDVCSLIGAAVLRAGWSKDLSLLSEPCLVIKASQTDLEV